MDRIRADEIVAVYLAQASAAADRLLPAQREDFLDRLHDKVRERVGPRPRRDVEAVSAALAELGEPADLVEREWLGRWSDAKVRDGRRQYRARPWPGPADRATLLESVPATVGPAPGAGLDPDDELDPDAELTRAADGLDAAVGRQRDWDSPTEVHLHPLFRDTRPEPIEPTDDVPGPNLRGRLRALRWELGALAMFVVGPQFVGLLALLLGAVMVAKSTYWEVRDKVRALLGIPLLGALFVLIRAWAESTQLNELESSSTRLRAAGESLLDSLGVAVPVLGLLIAAWLGWLVARDGHWSETTGHARRSDG